jgi:hypothetical protein
MASAISAVPTFRETIEQALPSREKFERIKSLALKILLELAISLSVAIAIAPFVATPFGPLLVFAGALCQSAISAYARAIRFFAEQKGMAKSFPEIARRAAHVPPAAFAIGTATHVSTFIHESGHALAARAVYRNANPTIQIFPFTGGRTTFNPNELSSFGKKLGETRSIALVTAAGPLLSLTVSLAALAASLFMRKSHPETSRYLETAALSDFLTHAFYALSALWTPRAHLSHDFVRLATLGLHPLAAAAAIAAAPILLILGITALQQKQCHPKPPGLKYS